MDNLITELEDLKISKDVLCNVDIDPTSVPKLILTPTLLDRFVIGKDKNVSFSLGDHKYFKEKLLEGDGKVDIDLNEGYETYIPKPRDERIDQILGYIINRADKVKTDDLRRVS